MIDSHKCVAAWRYLTTKPLVRKCILWTKNSILVQPRRSPELAALSYDGVFLTTMQICSKIKTHALVEHVRLMPQRRVLAEVFSNYFYSLHFKSLQLLRIQEMRGQCHDNSVIQHFTIIEQACQLTRLVVTISSNHLDWDWLYRSTHRIRSSPVVREHICYWTIIYYCHFGVTIIVCCTVSYSHFCMKTDIQSNSRHISHVNGGRHYINIRKKNALT